MEILKGNARAPVFAIMILLLISVFAALFPATVTAVEEPPRDQTLVILSCIGDEVDAHNALMSYPAYFTSLMYPSLYLYSPYSDEWIPYLAESCSWLDKITLMVTIRDEAKWWDGTPITAEDVKYSLELGKKYNVPMYTPHWIYLEDVTVVSDKVVVFYLNQSTLNYFQALDMLWQPLILPKARWQNLEAQYGAALTTDFEDDDPENIVGGGPYRLMDLSLTDKSYYQRVDDWWGTDIFGLPNPKYLATKICRNTSASNEDLYAGVIDVSTHMIPEIWTRFPTGVRTYYPDPPYFVSQWPLVLYINYLKAPLDNPIIRRAIAHASPTADMVSMYYYNSSVPTAAVPIIHTGPAAKYINQTLVDQYGWTYNITKAEEILDDANITDVDDDGFREMPDGTELSGFTIQVPDFGPEWVGSCELIAQNLNQIGIGVTPEYPDFQLWENRIVNGELDLFIGWSGAFPGSYHPWNAFSFSMDNRQSFPLGNLMNYPDSGAGLVGSAVAKPLIDAIPKEANATKIASMYSQLQEIWLKDVVAIPLYYTAGWYEYQTVNWVGFPSADYPWLCDLYISTPGTSGWPSQLPMLFTVVPAGQTPTVPTWVNNMKFSTDQMHGNLEADPKTTDLNTDGAVDIVDMTVAALAFGSVIGDPKYDVRADIDDNGVIDIVDLAKIAKDFTG
ncbi:MAG TPA: ABC transporter substrate-binding protein [Candidatus Bathyarchaeia archaeon]